MTGLTKGYDLIWKLKDYYPDKFLGTFLRDKLPDRNKFKLGCAIIFNLEPNENKSKHKGTHWTCAINTKNGIIYIDPLGVDAPQFAARWMGNYRFSNSEYQPIRSLDCGRYCVYFISNFFNNEPFNKNLTNYPTTTNDKLVEKFFVTI